MASSAVHRNSTLKLCGLFLCFVSFGHASEPAEESNNVTLTFLLIISNSDRFNSSGAEIAANLAVDNINTKSSILHGYKLGLGHVRDSKVMSEFK